MKSYDTEKMIVKLLRVGVLISTVLILLGFIMLYFKESSVNISSIEVNSIKEVINGLARLEPYAVIMTGLLILILTPILRVIIGILGFYLEKDYIYVKISSIVLIILILSFLIGVI